jgi:hypothetical protein
MIEFNPDNIHFDVVYLHKVNRTTLEVVSDENGNPYRPANVNHRVNNKGNTMIDIHQKVSQLYLKKTPMAEFSGAGKKAYLFYYGNRVIVMDIYRYSTSHGVAEKDWVSVCVAAFNRVATVIKEDSLFEDKTAKMYFDGEHLFFLSPRSELNMGHPHFSVRAVRAIHLGRMAVKSTFVTSEQKEKGENNNTHIVVHDGVVIIYRPFGEDDSRQVISPVYMGISDRERTRIKKETGSLFAYAEFMKQLQEYGQNANKMRYTLAFALKAGKIIGKHYGYLETEFLNIPKIVLDTGVINLVTDIDLRSRERYPLDIPFFDGLAYLMRFFYRETNMDTFRDLSSLFSFTMKSGIRKLDNKVEDDQNVFKDEFQDKGVPALNVKEFKENWIPSKSAEALLARLSKKQEKASENEVMATDGFSPFDFR